MTKYLSHIKNLRIVVVPGEPIFSDGRKIGDKQGKYAQFTGGEFMTDDQEIIDKLENCPTFGIDFVLDSKEPKKEEEKPGEDLSKLTVPQLKAKAAEAGIEVPESAKKADILALLEPKKEEEQEAEDEA
jgi:hypothetical protein